MSDASKSPAVQSMLNEQGWQRNHFLKGDLDTALEDTFPASDPVAMAVTSVASPRSETTADPVVENLPSDEDYPLVNAALDSVRNRVRQEDDNPTSEEIAAIASETDRVKESVSLIADATVRAAKAGTSARLRSFRDHIRDRPLLAVGFVAALGFLWGASR